MARRAHRVGACERFLELAYYAVAAKERLGNGGGGGGAVKTAWEFCLRHRYWRIRGMKINAVGEGE